MGADHEVVALSASSVELVDLPPLVNRANPHNLAFFDGMFNLTFSTQLDEALFPAEMERTVGSAGSSIVVHEEVGVR